MKTLSLYLLCVVARRNVCRNLSIIFALFIAIPCWADSFTFGLLPPTGNVVGNPGSTVGWGYSITNTSPSDWLVTTNLNADLFSYGTPSLLFDFPVVAPGATTAESFDPINRLWLYELIWAISAPSGYVNTGNFTLSAQWWSGNPSNGGSYISNAPDTLVGYSATVTPSDNNAPEPASVYLCLIALAIIGLVAFRRPTSFVIKEH